MTGTINIKTRIAVVAGLTLASLALVVTTALAKPPTNGDDCKPGWGWGANAQGKCHDGPPGGPSVHPVHGTP